jgi:hypothetical protein
VSRGVGGAPLWIQPVRLVGPAPALSPDSFYEKVGAGPKITASGIVAHWCRRSGRNLLGNKVQWCPGGDQWFLGDAVFELGE